MTAKNQYLLLIISCLFLLIPNILLIFIGEDTVVASNLKKIVFFLFSVAIISVALIFIKPKWAVFINLILTPLAIFEMFNVYHFKAPSTEESIASLFFTNYSEVTEFVGSFMGYVYIFLVILFLQIYLFIRIKKDYNLSKKVKGMLLIFSSVILISLYVRDCSIANKFLKEQSSINEVIDNATYLYQVKLKKVFPLSLFLKFSDAKIGVRKLKEYVKITKSFKFESQHQKKNTIPEIYVLVIGETARKHNFGVYGYKRNTTPFLNSITDLIVYNNIKSSANLTSHSIPHILTRATPNNDAIKFTEPAIINAFKEADFKTYWLSNQAVGVGGVFGIYASLADEYQNIAVSFDVSTFDEKLLPIFDEVINKDKHQKKFIIIHTIGSHFRYNLRYDEKFDVFKPSLEKGLSLTDNSIKIKDKLVNSYDNSILYTDFIISSFINQLKETNTISSLYYISDHGENLYDDENEFLLHAYPNPSKYEIEIPLLVWNSKEYKETFPAKDAVLRSHKNSRISTTNTFHTLLDIASIKYPTEKLHKSFANKKFDSLQSRYLLKTDKSVIKLD